MLKFAQSFADLFKVRPVLGKAVLDGVFKRGFISADMNFVVSVHHAHALPSVLADEESAQRFKVMRILCEYEIICVLGRTELVSPYRFGRNVFNIILAEIFIVERNTAESADIHLLIKIDVEKSAAGRAQITLY